MDGNIPRFIHIDRYEACLAEKFRYGSFRPELPRCRCQYFQQLAAVGWGKGGAEGQGPNLQGFKQLYQTPDLGALLVFFRKRFAVYENFLFRGTNGDVFFLALKDPLKGINYIFGTFCYLWIGRRIDTDRSEGGIQPYR